MPAAVKTGRDLNGTRYAITAIEPSPYGDDQYQVGSAVVIDQRDLRWYCKECECLITVYRPSACGHIQALRKALKRTSL
jgi:hypothetical protein